MWSAKIGLDGRKNVLADYAMKHDVRVLIFPLSWSYECDGVLVNICGTLYGESKSKKRFIREWKREGKSRLLDVELNGDFFIGIVREDLSAKNVYNKNLIFTKPFSIDEKGYQIFIVNSFEKKFVEDFIRVMEGYHGAVRIYYLKKEKFEDVSFRVENPSLTDKQKSAMELAIRQGYYDYPRKVSIKKLAKFSKLGFTTFHSHLRKAEQKLLPFFFRR